MWREGAPVFLSVNVLEIWKGYAPIAKLKQKEKFLFDLASTQLSSSEINTEALTKIILKTSQLGWTAEGALVYT